MFGAKIVWVPYTSDVIVFNEDEIYIPDILINDSVAITEINYLNEIFGYNVEYLEEFNVIYIDTYGSLVDKSIIKDILPSYENYTEEDLMWLSRIIYAEAKGEPYEGKLAVGSVIINRKNSSNYPSTIEEVIFDRKNGVQFSPTINGSIYNEPCSESFLAAIEVLEGKTNAREALFFMNSDIATTTWISQNRELAFSMENHDFFY